MNSLLIVIELLTTKKPNKPLFGFTRITLALDKEETDELNFGEQEIALNKDEWFENASFLAKKFAQVTFK